MVNPSKTRQSSSQSGISEDISNLSTMPDASATPAFNLANHFLIAMPSMLDPVFGGAVVYLCEHNAQGALGVIVNKVTDMNMDTLFERIDLEIDIVPQAGGNRPVMFGGPVQVERGFVLHSPLGAYSSTMQVSDEIALTTSKDILEAAAAGKGPERILVSLGCAGWSAGQLEDEIVRNGWLTVPARPEIVFDMPVEQRFAAAMKLLGIDPAMLAGVAGHA